MQEAAGQEHRMPVPRTGAYGEGCCEGGQALTSSVYSCLTKTHCFTVSSMGELGLWGLPAPSRESACPEGSGLGVEGEPGCLIFGPVLTQGLNTGCTRGRKGKARQSQPQSPRASLCKQWSFRSAMSFWRQGLEAGYSKGHLGTWVAAIVETMLPPAGECSHLTPQGEGKP